MGMYGQLKKILIAHFHHLDLKQQSLYHLKMDNSGEKINVVIVEDDKNQAELLRVILATSGKYNVAGMAESYEECIELLNSNKIDMMTVDIEIKGSETGIDIIRYATDKYKNILTLVHTINEDSEILFDALKAGAGGYILKGASLVDIFSSIERLCAGDVPMTPKIARRLIATFKENKDTVENELLSKREMEILNLADRGFSYQQIAEHCKISKHTVHTHFKNIYAKLQVNSKQIAIKKAKNMAII
jgi:DNA-binding NarL/FixJ family response regulator